VAECCTVGNELSYSMQGGNLLNNLATIRYMINLTYHNDSVEAVLAAIHIPYS
jgi:hypothetical protein